MTQPDVAQKNTLTDDDSQESQPAKNSGGAANTPAEGANPDILPDGQNPDAMAGNTTPEVKPDNGSTTKPPDPLKPADPPKPKPG